MKKQIIDLSTKKEYREQVDYLSRLAYEVESSKNIIVEIMERHKNEINYLDNPIFKEYHSKFEKAFAKYEIAKGEFAKNVLPEEHKNNPNATWNLIFNDYELTITY